MDARVSCNTHATAEYSSDHRVVISCFPCAQRESFKNFKNVDVHCILLNGSVNCSNCAYVVCGRISMLIIVVLHSVTHPHIVSLLGYVDRKMMIGRL